MRGSASDVPQIVMRPPGPYARRMFVSRLFLGLTALVFGGFGIWGALDPVGMVRNFGIALASGDASTLIRASYGGFLMGEAAVIGFCACSQARVRLGLQIVILLTAPIFVTRALGMLADGARSPIHISYLGIEAAGILVAALFLLLGRGNRSS